jgi:hypothetical protein
MAKLGVKWYPLSTNISEMYLVTLSKELCHILKSVSTGRNPVIQLPQDWAGTVPWVLSILRYQKTFHRSL